VADRRVVDGGDRVQLKTSTRASNCTLGARRFRVRVVSPIIGLPISPRRRTP